MFGFTANRLMMSPSRLMKWRVQSRSIGTAGRLSASLRCNFSPFLTGRGVTEPALSIAEGGCSKEFFSDLLGRKGQREAKMRGGHRSQDYGFEGMDSAPPTGQKGDILSLIPRWALPIVKLLD